MKLTAEQLNNIALAVMIPLTVAIAAWVIADFAGVLTSGHRDAYVDETGQHTIELCPSMYLDEKPGDVADSLWYMNDQGDRLSTNFGYVHVATVLGTCEAILPGVTQVRRCGDDPHNVGKGFCEENAGDGKMFMDAVTLDGKHAWLQIGATSAYKRHVVNHVVGIGGLRPDGTDGHATHGKSTAAAQPGIYDSGIPFAKSKDTD